MPRPQNIIAVKSYKVVLITEDLIVVMLRSPYLVKFTTAHMNSLTFLMDY